MPINELAASAPASPDNTLSSQDAELYDRMDWKHVRAGLFGRRLSVVSFGQHSKFLIGVQIASLLKRETFNMYRSMKIKNVDIQRASPQQVDFLAKVNAVRPGTHSVTLIPYDDGLYFVADAWMKQHKDDVISLKGSSSSLSTSAAKAKANKSFIQERPKLHRRKPLPWDIHRSIKKNDIKDPSKFIISPNSPSCSSVSSSSSSSSSFFPESPVCYSAPCSPISPTELLTAAAASLAAADSLVQQSSSSSSAFPYGGPSPRTFYCR